MRRRRWWLALASVASLVVLIYAGVFTAYSVPVTEEMARANTLPGRVGPEAGTRALVLPSADITTIPTLATAGPENATLVVIAEPGSTFPASAPSPSLARALAYVAPTTNGSYVPATLTLNLTRLEGADVVTSPVTLDVAALAGGKRGFIVKGDAEPDAWFAETERVQGVVSRYDASTLLVSYFVLGSIGFVLPLVVLIVTHRGTGTPGLPKGVAAGTCPECRAPIAVSAEFCTRCGAWLKERKP